MTSQAKRAGAMRDSSSPLHRSSQAGWAARRASWLIWGHDVLALVLGQWAALVVRYQLEGKVMPTGLMGPALLATLILAAAVVPAFRLHKGVWRYTTYRDLWRLLRAVVLVNLLVLPVLFVVTRLEDYPRTAPVIATVLGFLFAGSGRAGLSMIARKDWRSLLPNKTTGVPTILVGDMAHCDGFIRGWREGPLRPTLRPLALVCPNDPNGGRRLHNLPLMGVGPALERLIKAHSLREDVHVVFIEGGLADEGFARDVIRHCGPMGVQFLKAQADGRGISPLSADELLTRPARTPDLPRIERLVRGRRVMITGAGGAIGSELARLIAPHQPEALILAEQSEFALYDMHLGLKTQHPDCALVQALVDVRDRRGLTATIEMHTPQLILHAAALKHVPIAEAHPAETILTNVKGTLEVLKAARHAGADFVLISTDKAVMPTSVMGASKRLCELMTASFGAYAEMQTAAVRFGNVLGSSGSVVPLFERQIDAGGPITLTDPEATRYFMTVREAASLVLQAATLSKGLYVLDMGEPVSILTMAKRLLRLKGLDEEAFPIVTTGLREGEKRHESLFLDGEVPDDTEVEGLWRVVPKTVMWRDLEDRVLSLIKAAELRDTQAIFSQLQTLIPEYQRTSQVATARRSPALA